MFESGEGSIWSENMGEAGTWDTVVLKTQVIVMAALSNEYFENTHTHY